jgi:hypothetical protein
MEKFTTSQLKSAFIELATKNDEDSNRAYRLCFDELNRRLGDEKFDRFCDEIGI